MPVCPSCKEESKNRENGRCPKCNTKVDLYKGHWVRSGTNTPPEEILRYFEGKVSERLSIGRPVKVAYSIPRKGIRIQRELVSAERILKMADYDIDLVLKSIDILFRDKSLGWKSRDSLIFIDQDFIVALAIARSEIEAELQEEERSRQVIERLMSQESLF